MPLIPEPLIDEIQLRIDLAEFIGRYVPLKRSGRHFKANCPFHKERTPSFMINSDKQIFHCFGCGVGGNIFSFLMLHDRVTFPEAVQQLAEHVGVPLPQRQRSSSESDHKALCALLEQACRFFERTLAASQGSAARTYAQNRGVSEPTRQRFRLGLAPEGWRRLLSAATKQGTTPAQLEAVGLLVRGASSAYDRFRNRLMFPIIDLRERVIGFGGRSLDAQEPKYLNSPETALYSKGRHLFGLTQAKDAIIREKTAVIVEGYFDCVVLVDGGFSHVVSPLGTAFTVDQARLLKRYAERVILAFDADAAGEEATRRGIDVLVELGLQVHVAQLPPGMDPDEALRAHGRAWMEQLFREAINLCEFLIRSALRRYPSGAMEDRVQAAQWVLPTIAKVPDAMLRSEYLRLIAQRLRLDEQAVAQELMKVTSRLASAARSAQDRSTVASPSMSATVVHATTPVVATGPERLLIALVLDDPSRAQRLQRDLPVDEIADPMLRRILSVVYEETAAGRVATPAQLVSRLTEEGLGGAVTALVTLAQTVTAQERAFEECLQRVRAQTRTRELALLQDRIRTAQLAEDHATVHRLLVEYQQRFEQRPTAVKGDADG